jgi:hypothetical protein
MKRLLPAALFSLLPALARADSDLAELIVPIGIVGTVFGFTAIIVAVVAYARHRSNQLRHETIRLAIEKGQPLPPDLLDAPSVRDSYDARGRNTPERDLRRGLVLLALGIGLCLYLGVGNFTGSGHHWAVGFIPGLIGAAYLVAYAVGRGRGPSAPPPARE